MIDLTSSQEVSPDVAAVHDVVIVANHLGVDPSGTTIQPLGDATVQVNGGGDAVIGGATVADRNVIGGTNGVLVSGGVSQTRIIGYRVLALNVSHCRTSPVS